jgi:aminopeptidase N
VLYALRQEIGHAAFQRIEREWLRRYGGGSASTEDFIRLASQIARRNLRGFLEDWLYGETTPPMPGHPDWTVNPVEEPAPALTIQARPRARP